jgi:signal transduction histidine kinase
MLTTNQASIRVDLEKRNDAFGLVLIFSSGKNRMDLVIEPLGAVFDEVEEFQDENGFESIKTFKSLPDPTFDLTDEFIAKERELVQRLTKEELYAQLRAAYAELDIKSEGLDREVNERKKAEVALKEYSEKLEDMVEKRTKELRDAQEELIRKEKLATLGQLAGGVSHELRNPLGAIKNAAYFLNMAIAEPEPEVKETLEILEKEVGTSDRIISGLLDFARPKAPVREKLDINQLIKEALSRTAVPENIRVVSKLDETAPNILADQDQLERVFGNLVLNGIQAMPEGGELTVESTISDPDWVTVSFTDTGVGIPEELGKVFEPLFTTKAKGIGLGLALSRVLVEEHGGTIGVESEVGKGSTFKVRLPTGELTIED